MPLKPNILLVIHHRIARYLFLEDPSTVDDVDDTLLVEGDVEIKAVEVPQEGFRLAGVKAKGFVCELGRLNELHDVPVVCGLVVPRTRQDVDYLWKGDGQSVDGILVSQVMGLRTACKLKRQV